MQRDAFGLPDLVPVVIDHPLSPLSDAKRDQRRTGHTAMSADLAWVMTAESSIAIDAMPYFVYI